MGGEDKITTLEPIPDDGEVLYQTNLLVSKEGNIWTYYFHRLPENYGGKVCPAIPFDSEITDAYMNGLIEVWRLNRKNGYENPVLICYANSGARSELKLRTKREATDIYRKGKPCETCRPDEQITIDW
ncbi:MAG: hypothetical protein LBC53_07200 [Spirochaetaceae bacterium]|nr:hypothetical protein [Spirochaetaceae bacterium]